MTVLNNGYHDVPAGKLAMVVTHLEMRAPAALRPCPAPDGVTFERAEKPAPDWYRDLHNRVGGHDWLWFSRLKMSDAELSAIVHDPRVHIWTLTRHGQAEGLLELDFRQKDACELAFFGVTAALIGTGAGRFLMNQAITLAWTQGETQAETGAGASPISRFHVHTCTLDHPDAVGFYIRSGFTATHQQIEIDDDPRITGEFPASAGPRTPVFP